MSDTPRTDAAQREASDVMPLVHGWGFARQLERELALAVDALKKIINGCADLIECLETADTALAELEKGGQR